MMHLRFCYFLFTDALTEDETFEKTTFSVKENTTLGIVFIFVCFALLVFILLHLLLSVVLHFKSKL